MIKNIVYFSHAEKGASGGAKIIYHHSEIINSLNNFSSEVVHLKMNKLSKIKISVKKRFKIGNNNNESGWQFNDLQAAKKFNYKWFEHNIKTRDKLSFNKKKDFLILPEIFAHLAEDLCIKNRIDYAIFVQNGYVISSTNNEKKLSLAYSKAKFIISYSEDITNCIKTKFPKLKTKIIKISYALDLKNSPINRKKNVITYMSRKLPQHSYLVTNYLKPHLPSNWSIKDINNLNEKKTYDHLKKSKIFLSFSHMEGLPLPPAEAALAGNFVIGYTGEGGNEYWKKPLFTKINSGEIKTFVKEILKKTLEIRLGKKPSKKQMSYLKLKFSKKEEIKNIKNFLKYIND
tara:strand:+ start:84 stop:1118 length:1035 start_codon:yes stop_codon:yes gene_type:complete